MPVEVFDSVLWRISQGLEQSGRNKDGNIVGLATEQPRHLLNREPGWRLPNQRQKLMLLFFHASLFFAKPQPIAPTEA
jgi:hypothetical protein